MVFRKSSEKCDFHYFCIKSIIYSFVWILFFLQISKDEPLNKAENRVIFRTNGCVFVVVGFSYPLCSYILFDFIYIHSQHHFQPMEGGFKVKCAVSHVFYMCCQHRLSRRNTVPQIRPGELKHQSKCNIGISAATF